MLIPIGPHDRPLAVENGPAELLAACHARIRRFSDVARRLALAGDAPLDEVAAAAAELHRYHTVALPLHQRDEEELLRPRLERAGATGELLAALEVMAAEHVALDGVLARLVPSWAMVAQEPARLAQLSRSLKEDAERLGALWALHLTAEEAVIFPAIARLLAAEEQQAMLAEMRALRAPLVAAGSSGSSETSVDGL